MPAASKTIRMTVPRLESLRSRILQSQYWHYLGSLGYSRRSSRNKASGKSESNVSQKLRFVNQPSKGHVDHFEVCESFAGIDVKVPNAALVSSCLRSMDRLNAMDLESGGGIYVGKN